MAHDLFSLSAYQFELPSELIAQQPCEPRDHSRLLIVDKEKGNFSEIPFYELKHFLNSGDTLIFNDTKVIPARLIGQRENGGQAEVFLNKRLSENMWNVLAKPGKKMRPGSWVMFGNHLRCQVLETAQDGSKIVRFDSIGSFESALEQYGRIPLPHYIREGVANQEDYERYQTVYANKPGAVAAPTAGLHFTKGLLQSLANKGISQHHLTLHVGLGTFKPVQTEDIRQHLMHEEHVVISKETAEKLNQRSALQRQICVGTTCCRALESSADEAGRIAAGESVTNIFIYPGYKFKYVRSLLTNFHLPGSSLLMLVCSLAGYELTMEAYQKAIKDRFRFYSYGDAMLII
jgi:S-adenosylmethionine:tRNA ribosyltransferase-isomerase